jgi:hypothetical protein
MSKRTRKYTGTASVSEARKILGVITVPKRYTAPLKERVNTPSRIQVYRRARRQDREDLNVYGESVWEF